MLCTSPHSGLTGFRHCYLFLHYLTPFPLPPKEWYQQSEKGRACWAGQIAWTWKGSYVCCDQGTMKKSAWSEKAQERTEALCEPWVLATRLSVHSGAKFGRPWWWKERDGTAGGKPERQAAFQSLLTEIAKGEGEKTPCFHEIFIKKQNKTVSNGLFECISLARNSQWFRRTVLLLCVCLSFSLLTW